MSKFKFRSVTYVVVCLAIILASAYVALSAWHLNVDNRHEELFREARAEMSEDKKSISAKLAAAKTDKAEASAKLDAQDKELADLNESISKLQEELKVKESQK